MAHERNEKLSTLVLRGSFWVFCLRLAARSLTVVKLIIIARILAPGEYGIMGIALLVMATLETFSQTGFQHALLQKKNGVAGYLDTVWTSTIVRGVLLFLVLYLAAPLAASFFGTTGAAAVIRVAGISILLKSVVNVGVVYFQKELRFDRQFAYRLSGLLADFAVSVAVILTLRNVWALVFGLLAGDLASIIASYAVHPYRPRPRLDTKRLADLFGFGKWIFGSSILVFLITQGDDIFVGRLLGATALGLYQMAYRISNIPATEFSHLLSTVTYPAYSKLQDNLPKLGEAYCRVLGVTLLAALPVAGLILILAPEFTGVFLGGKWLSAIPLMQVLALFGLMRAIGATTGVVFMAVGKPGIRTRIQAAQLVLLAVIIYPLTMRWGLTGTSIAVTIDALVFNLVAVNRVFSLLRARSGDVWRTFLFSLLSTVVSAALVLLLKRHVLTTPNVRHFLALAASGVCCYLIMVYITDSLFHYIDGRYIRERLFAPGSGRNE